MLECEQKKESQDEPAAAGYQEFNWEISGCQECAACNLPITSRYLLLSMGKTWHPGCLRCDMCEALLMDERTDLLMATGRCYEKDGMILCTNDYVRLYNSTSTGSGEGSSNSISLNITSSSATNCHGCLMSIRANEPIIRGPQQTPPAVCPVYHMSCMLCGNCHRPLQSGDKYAMHRDQPICEADFGLVFGGAGAAGGGKNAEEASAKKLPSTGSPPTRSESAVGSTVKARRPAAAGQRMLRLPKPKRRQYRSKETWLTLLGKK